MLRTINNEVGWRDQKLILLVQESVELCRPSEVLTSNPSVVKLATPERATPTTHAIEYSVRSIVPTVHLDIFTVILDRVWQLLGSGAKQPAFDDLVMELSSEYREVGLGFLTGTVEMARPLCVLRTDEPAKNSDEVEPEEALPSEINDLVADVGLFNYDYQFDTNTSDGQNFLEG